MTSHIEVPPPDQETIDSACLSYRHDFCLLDGGRQSVVRAEARRWLSAWRSGYAAGGQPPGPRGLGDGDAEPHARTIDAACVSFDPAFRTRPFHDASALRRNGIEWLWAWRKAFEDDMTPAEVAKTFDDLGAAIRAATAAGVLPTMAASPLDRLPDSVVAALDDEPGRPDAIQPDVDPVDQWSADHDQRVVVLHAATDRFAEVFAEGIAEGLRAMQRFPQPTYPISKFAEEAGEVVKELIHLAEGRSTLDKVRGEMAQAIGQLFRLWIEGDQVHGLPPLSDPEAAPFEVPDGRIAALVRCTKAGVPTDVQGLLVNGDPAKGIPRDIVGLILGVAKPRASDGT
jgi:hypothetical protein